MNSLSPAIKYVLVVLSTGIIFLAFFLWIYRVHHFCGEQGYERINPALKCEPAYVIDKQPYIGLKHELIDYIESQQADGRVNEVSVYFRDLNNGPTLGINEHANFVPASLLKLPVYLAYLSYQEEHPDLMSERLILHSIDTDLTQTYPSTAGLEVGATYTVEELLEAMIVHSDNSALYRLEDYLFEISPDRNLQLETYIDLGIIDPENIQENTVSTKGYASIFLQLYHSSFFGNQESSNQALELLARSTFDSGLVAGVPGDVDVAHKFGERFFSETDVRQLHDCGVVYYPDNAYLLCIMTRGKNFSELEGVIKEISAKVYAEFDSRRLK